MIKRGTCLTGGRAALLMSAPEDSMTIRTCKASNNGTAVEEKQRVTASVHLPDLSWIFVFKTFLASREVWLGLNPEN